MNALKRLEQMANEYWQLAQKVKGVAERQRYLKLHHETYLQLRRQREWLKALGVGHE